MTSNDKQPNPSENKNPQDEKNKSAIPGQPANKADEDAKKAV